MTADETRDGVPLTNLDTPLSDDAGATKRELVDYLDGAHARILPALEGRPLSVIRVLRGQRPFMQKNLPRYAPEWLPRVSWWAESSRRDVTYALCDDRRSLLWFANQRAVEYHPTLVRADSRERATTLVLDIDPPEGAAFPAAVAAAFLVRAALAEAGMVGAVKTSGAKGLHVVVPVADVPVADAAAATRALAARAERLDPERATTAFVKADRDGKVFLDSTRSGTATVVSVYSPRARPGTPVSFPVAWEELQHVSPAAFTMPVAGRLLADADPWAELLPPPQRLTSELVDHGRTIPVARVQAMHEGRRRARKSVGTEQDRVQPGGHGDHRAER